MRLTKTVREAAVIKKGSLKEKKPLVLKSKAGLKKEKIVF